MEKHKAKGKRYVYFFGNGRADGDGRMKDLLGGKGAGLAENTGTLQILWEEGIRYVGDWVNDDQPYPFTVGDGTLLSMPYPLEINDILVCIYTYRDSEDFYRMICNQFDVLYEEGASNGRVMGISLHPYIIGVPHRIKALDRA
ncbi:MAG: hypothetical protein HYT87_19180, partial [Nitrospirae bacterium]|nr:hypothetical protein [Nitrospirota bacterium]